MKRTSSLNTLMGFQPLKTLGLIALLLAISFTGKAQVDVTATGGSTSATYTTLKLAFDSINTGYHTGVISITLTGNTTETASAILNASGAGGASYTSITISPSGGATRTISGSLAAALIDLNGADNVIIDGLNSGGNALIIDNSNTGASGVSTIRFINDASSNQILNSTIRGASTAVTLGTVLFSTGTTTGNDNNLIQGCTVEGSGANLPANAIVSIGTATAGIENSNNFITLNNISNFFSATLVTNGVLVGAGNTDWAVSRNKLYQTASRAYTTANTHQIISITSGNNHRVDSNTIGYSSSTATGTYAMTSTVATRIIAISLSVGTTVASSVQFNTVTAISLTTTNGTTTGYGSFCGISAQDGKVNIGTIYGNTIGSTTGTGAITVTSTSTAGAAVVGINSASADTVQIHNNYVGALTSSGSTATAGGSAIGVTVSAAAASISVRYNTLGNATADNMRGGTSGLSTGTCLSAGISAASNSDNADFSRNTIRNFSSFGTGTSAYARGIMTTSTAGSNPTKIDSNIIYNITARSGMISKSAGMSALGILIGTGLDPEIAGNTIYNIQNTNAGALATDVAGIYTLDGNGPRMFGNLIYKIKNASTSTAAAAPGTASGIAIRSAVATTSVRVFNNMISLGAGEVTNTAFIGVWATHAATPNPVSDSIYHNTITIEGNGATGSQPSFGIYRGDFSTTARTVTLVAYNNILTNNRSGGTGKHYAISNNYGATTPSATGWGTNATDYNILNSTNVANVASWGNTDQTFADWKTISGCDVHSYSATPVHYVDSSIDLHMNMGTILNPIESNAFPLTTITTDIDGDARPGPVGSVNGGGFVPDIGADEFDGVGVDNTPPQINYTALAKTCSTGDRILTATLIDQTGVYTVGSLMPRIYYHKSSGGSWYSQPGTLMSGTTTNGIWEFPILSADMGSLVFGDSVYYYVIAQDSGAAGVNIKSTPAGVVADDVNTITTHPTTPYNYPIGTDLNGLYTLNSGTANSSTNFQTLAFLQSALTNACISGPVTVEITTGSGPYSGSLLIPAMDGLSATNNFTLFGNNETIHHTPNTTNRHIIKLDGADYVTLKNIHITGLAVDFDWGIHLTNGADHDSILNCVINLSANTSSTIDNSACIVASGSTTDVNAAGNNANYLTIQNCELIGGFQGLIINGSTTNNSMHNLISNNIIHDFYSIGTELTHNDSTVYEFNNVSRGNRATVGTFEGIEMGSGNKQLRVNANRFHNTHNSASSQTGAAYGIYSTVNDAPVGLENRITNNLVYNFNSDSGTIYGIYNSGSDGAHYYHNTISLDHPATGTGITRGVYQTTAATNIDFRNNIISITRGGAGIKYCLYYNMNTSSIISDNNNLYMNASSGTNAIGYYDGAVAATFADWKLVNTNAFDQQSVASNPSFTSIASNNYIPRSALLNDIGDSVGVFTDFAGNTRPNTTPDPGAFEYTPAAVDAQISWIAPVAPLATGNHTVTVNITNNSLAATVTDIELEYFDGTSIVSETFSSLSIAPSASQQFSFSTQYSVTGSAILQAYIKSVNGVTDGSQSNDTTQKSLCLAFAAGTYTIDASLPTGSGNFNSFSAAINQLSCGILGPVVFDVVPGSGPYTEQITIPAIAGSSAINRITFNGNGDTIEYTPITSARHIIKLDGADYITLRNLYIKGNSADYNWGIFLTNEANYDSIENCTINILATTSTTVDNSASIAAAGIATDVNSAGNNANHLTVTGCTMMGGYYGAVINGNALNSQNNNLINNTIQDFYSIGIEYTRMDSCLIEGNDISRANRVGVTTFEGIEIGADNKRIHVSKNKIHDTHNSATTQSGSAYGIYHTADDAPVGFENIVSNNIIYNFNSTTGLIYGIYSSGSDGVHYYYNTIDLSHPDATSGTTYGIYQITAASNIEIKNNIISITRGGSGTKNCLRFATTGSSIVSNNNDLYMNSTGTVGVGYYGGNEVTLADWKLVNGGAFDQQSIDNNPLFNGSDLLIPMPVSATVGAGTPISGITKDILDSTRHLTTPTIGAYEFAIDVLKPEITLQSIANVPIGLNRTLNNFATVTDVSGIDTNTNKPRLYFRKSTDDNTYIGNTSADNGWKWTEATNTVSPFSFDIDYSMLFGGSVNGGDTLQYFVVAQDLAAEPNLSSSNGVFAIQPDSVDLTVDAFPVTGNLSYYRILPDVAGGTITVGTSGNYLNLTAALTYLKQNNFTADVLVELLSDYNGSTETLPLSFSDILRSDSSIKITIRPHSSVSTMLVTEGVPPTDMPLIDLNTTHHIYFDGRPDGTGDMSNIKWTIRNKRTVATFTPTIRLINDARFNVLEYLNIQSANTLATSGTILLSTTDGVYGNDSNIIRYNVIRDRSDTIGIPANAIYSAGSATATNHYNRVENNEMFNFTTGGVNISATGNGDNWTINNNSIYYNNTTAPTTAQTGILFAAASNHNTITNNSIGGTEANAAGTAWIHSGNTAFIGISAAFDSLSTSVISQNVIRNISKTNTGAGAFTGIIMSRGGALISQNVIGDTVIPNSIVLNGTGAITGISNTNPLANTLVTIEHNRVANITKSTATTGAVLRGISYTSGSPYPACNIMYNKIFKLSTYSTTVGYAAGSIAAQGIYTFPGGYGPTSEMAYNTVYDISVTNTDTIATNVSGITSTNFNGSIHHNTIYGIKNHSLSKATLRATANGLYVRFLDPGIIHHNMISLTDNPSDSVQLNGIMITGANGGTQYYFYNSVYVSNSLGSPVSSFAFHRGENSTTTQSYHPIVMQNNLFINNVTSAGLHYAVGNEGTRPDSAWNSNINDYNDFYSVNPATLTLWGTTTADLATWRTLSLGDAHTVSKEVFYTNTSTADLHLTGTSVGDFDLAGTPIANYTTDFDGEARNPVKPYMGADELLSNPVPVQLTQFTANALHKDVVLRWTTASEINSLKFIIEASADGKTFRPVGSVRAKGNSNSLSTYQFTHMSAQADFNGASVIYYRLISVDIDTKTSVSNIVNVSFVTPTLTKQVLQVAPNPFNNYFTLNINALKDENIQIEIINPMGTSVYSQTHQINEGSNKIDINNIENLPKGIYFVHVILNGEALTYKVLKN